MVKKDYANNTKIEKPESVIKCVLTGIGWLVATYLIIGMLYSFCG
jgi:hypothetical protein